MTSTAPIERTPSIGVFDSGIGGLSVLRHIVQLMPHEQMLYFADSGFAPYGEKPESVIVERTLSIAEFLLAQGAKALVVACNTATAASIRALRERYPELPVVGVEPGLKPAAAATVSQTVGVLATERTLTSEKFQLLREQIEAAAGVRFILQPCPGLAHQVEKGKLQSDETQRLLRRYVTPLLEQGADTLVLGCTHYPFVQPAIEDLVRQARASVTIIDTGDAVARQLQRLLARHGKSAPAQQQPALHGYTTGSGASLAWAFGALLGLTPTVSEVAAPLAQAAPIKPANA